MLEAKPRVARAKSPRLQSFVSNSDWFFAGFIYVFFHWPNNYRSLQNQKTSSALSPNASPPPLCMLTENMTKKIPSTAFFLFHRFVARLSREFTKPSKHLRYATMSRQSVKTLGIKLPGYAWIA